ncbi:MAG: beta-lactamase family protein [Candidatus Azobacteroides sp.]|nr:beta-lactamase family protein [Candidatus Azobacteroides sp.]
MNKILILSLASLINFAGLSQNIDKTKLDAYFDTLASNNRFMGSVAVSQNKELIYTKSVGFADIEQKLKADENSKYRIGSISKTFTTVLVFKAIEENKLDLNQTIDKFFPEIDNADKITITHLLYHRSGIHNFTDGNWSDWNTRPKTEREMIEIISKGGSDFEPDSKASYSNSNFVLLTFILEKIYQNTYSKILEEEIIQPVELKNTYYGGKINIKDNECNSYKYIEDWKIEPETNMSIPLGAGGIVSTPGDLNLFGEALFNGKLVSVNSLKQMETIKDHFGMGLLPMPFYDKAGFGHTGEIDGFSSMFAYFPDDNISFAYTANGINCNGNDIAIAVLSVVYNKPFEIPEFKTYQVTDEDLDKYSGVYSCGQIPLKITITKVNKTLIGQADGQPSFSLEATEKDKFKFEQAGAIMEFNPADKTMILKQGGGIFNFIKEN